MGLGGITRDSIADLASLVHDDDDSIAPRQRSFDDRRVGYIGVVDAVRQMQEEEYLILEERCGLNDDDDEVEKRSEE